MKVAFSLPLTLIALVGAGCCSIGTTYVERAKDLCGWKTTKLHGIPITLEVPHHFQVQVIETYYEHNQLVLRDSATRQPVVTRNATIAVVNTKEIFTVDFLRPAAGTLDTSLALDPASQYFTKIDNTIVDKTIQDITTAINTISGALTAAPGAKKAIALAPGLIPHDRVVAELIVEVADSHALEKMHAFLCEHLNGCSNCATHAGALPPSHDIVPPVPVLRSPDTVIHQ
jgi:hypothetical protein